MEEWYMHFTKCVTRRKVCILHVSRFCTIVLGGVWDKLSPCSPDWPRTQYVNQANLKSSRSDRVSLPRARIKGSCSHTRHFVLWGFLVLIFWDRISHIPGWPQACSLPRITYFFTVTTLQAWDSHVSHNLWFIEWPGSTQSLVHAGLAWHPLAACQPYSGSFQMTSHCRAYAVFHRT